MLKNAGIQGSLCHQHGMSYVLLAAENSALHLLHHLSQATGRQRKSETYRSSNGFNLHRRSTRKVVYQARSNFGPVADFRDFSPLRFRRIWWLFSIRFHKFLDSSLHVEQRVPENGERCILEALKAVSYPSS